MGTDNVRRVIFFVDDEPQVCKAVSQTLSTLDNCDVQCFESAERCLKALTKCHCDLLITDVNLPGMDGLVLLEEVKRIKPQLAVLLVTGYGDIPMAVKAVKAGALDFIEKPLEEASFLALVQESLEQCSLDPMSGKLLTKTETVILCHIAEGKSNKEIAYQLNRSVRTIENHRYRLMHKIGASNTVELVKKAMKMGLCQI